VFDPFFDDNPVSDLKVSDLDRVDYILVSHGHFDHFSDCIPLARQTGATVISTFELVSFCQSKGIEKGHGMNIGGAHRFPFGKVKLTPAVHTGSVAGDDEGTFTTDCCGFLLALEDGRRLYHSGDTALIVDMQLLRGSVDIALLPIGDNFTMGPEDAARAVEFIEPSVVIPMHYNTWELIAQDPADFRRMVGERAEVKILDPGGSYEF
jgi:L-ascorbate metabolism protein UlaG (beta-lactamase superfamily)